MNNIDTIVDLTKLGNPSDISQGVVRVNTNVKDRKERGIRRNKLVTIRNNENGSYIYALCRSNQRMNGNEIGLEYDQSLALGHVKGTSTYKIAPASKLCYLPYLMYHPNPSLRLTFVMGLIISGFTCLLGVFLGVLGSLLIG